MAPSMRLVRIVAALCTMGPRRAVGLHVRSAAGPFVQPPAGKMPWLPRLELTDMSLPFSFKHARISHNNLGGLGPDEGEASFIIAHAGKVEGEPFDLKFKVAEGSTYKGKTEKNQLLDGIVTINVHDGEQTKLDAEVLSSTGHPLELSRFFVSIFDIDAGSSRTEDHALDSVEVASVGPFDAYYMRPDACVNVVHANTGLLGLHANETGHLADNPSSPWDLSELQSRKAAMVEIRGRSTFSMEIGVRSQEPREDGRNFQFSGMSAMFSMPFGPCRQASFLKMSEASVIYNNLDGSAPSDNEIPDARQVRYANAGRIGGESVDLLVEHVGGTYNPADSTKTGLRGSLGQINFGMNDTTKLRFTIVSHSKSSPVEVQDFFFTYYDIDQNDGGYESLTLGSGAGTYFLSDDTTLLAFTHDDGSLTFNSTAKGTQANNPTEFDDLTRVEENEAVTLHFPTLLSSWEVTFAANANSGRNLLFGGMSSTACP